MTLGTGNGRSMDGFSRPKKDKGNHTEGDGAVVTETGIALVHEGELIFPAPDSEAETELALEDARTTVTINLPVIVQVHGQRDSAETDRIVDETLRRLREAVEARSEVS